jgi:hypothetical protein
MRVIRKTNLNNDQSGLASIFITMILMLVITLIVLGFAAIANRDQKNSLDSQLSTQAFYAAETGINETIRGINNYFSACPTAATVPCPDSVCPSPPNVPCIPIGPLLPFQQTADCYGSSGDPSTAYNGEFYYDHYLDSSHNVAYTCIILGGASTTTFPNTQIYQSHVVDVTEGSPPGTIPIYWTNTDTNPTPASANCPVSTSLPDFAAWRCNEAVLRVDYFSNSQAGLTGGPTGTGSYANLQNATTTVFLYPTNQATPANCIYEGTTPGSCDGGTSPNNGLILDADCQTYAPYCFASISNDGGGGYLRITPLYQPANIYLLEIGNNNQMIISATGKAQNITRKLQVNVSLFQIPGTRSDYAIQTTQSICKDFTTNYESYPTASTAPFLWPTSTNSIEGCNYSY